MLRLLLLASSLANAAPALPAADPDPAVEAQVTPTPEPTARRFNYGRAALEMGAALALGTTWYETQIEVNKVDFDFGRSLGEQWRRLGSRDGYRFDDNSRTLNIGHAFVGLYEHQFARANHGSLTQAFLFTLATSSVWELAVEHREVFSLNDTVVTAVGGVALGEPMFQLGEFFARSAPTWRNRILAGIFSPARAVASLDPDDRPRRAAVTDRYGFADDVHHRFELALGGSVTPGPAARGSGRGAARLDLELVNVRSWGRAGRAATRLRGGESTRLLVDYVGTSDDLEALTLFTKTSLFGVHRQDVRATGSDGLSGAGVILAASSAFDLSFDDAGAFTDFLSAVHVLGPSADVALHRGRFALRLGADVYGDFAMVRPFALGVGEEARAAVAGHKSPLRKQEYYYALGLTAAARVEARYRRARLGGSLEWNGYDSIEGLDRHQHAYTSPAGVHHAAIANDSSITDVRTRVRLFADAPLPATPFSLGLGLDLERRSGRLGEAARTAEEARLKLLLACAL